MKTKEHTEQQKAEAYVRSQIPELYNTEHSFCSIHRTLDMGCKICQAGWLSPQLQHWLMVLAKKRGEGSVGISGDGVMLTIPQGEVVNFNLTTGQPATEADYKAFNDIVGV